MSERTWLLLCAAPAVAMTADVVSAAVLLGAVTLAAVLCRWLRGRLNESARPMGCAMAAMFAVSAAQLLAGAWLPEVSFGPGAYLAALAVCMLNGEDRCGAKDVLIAMAALMVVAVLRELLGGGTFAGRGIEILKPCTVPILAEAPGGWLMMAVLAAVCSKCFSKERSA